MSTTDDRGGVDASHRRGSPNAGQFSTGTPRATMVQVDPKLIGCGCFGCSSILAFAGGLILLMLVTMVLLPTWRVNHHYVTGTCEVLETRLASKRFLSGDPERETRESYRPEIKIQYEVGGRTFESWTYDASGVYSSDKAAQQALVDGFKVGSTYPCWYDPDHHDQAVLVRSGGGVYLFLILPVGFLLASGLGFLFAWKSFSARPFPTTNPNAPLAEGLERPGLFRETHDATVDPARFHDPVAMTTDWTPITEQLANFQIHRLVEVDPDRLVYRATVGAWLFALVFLAGGIGAMAVVISRFSLNPIHLDWPFAALMALLLVISGGYLTYNFSTPIVFDRLRGYFWKGWKPPDELDTPSPDRVFTKLHEIHAVQLLKYQGVCGGSRFTAFELNLVLHGGERLKVVAYLKPSKAQTDASTLAQFLGKPLWDAS